MVDACLGQDVEDFSVGFCQDGVYDMFRSHIRRTEPVRGKERPCEHVLGFGREWYRFRRVSDPFRGFFRRDLFRSGYVSVDGSQRIALQPGIDEKQAAETPVLGKDGCQEVDRTDGSVRGRLRDDGGFAQGFSCAQGKFFRQMSDVHTFNDITGEGYPVVGQLYGHGRAVSMIPVRRSTFSFRSNRGILPTDKGSTSVFRFPFP